MKKIVSTKKIIMWGREISGSVALKKRMPVAESVSTPNISIEERNVQPSRIFYDESPVFQGGREIKGSVSLRWVEQALPIDTDLKAEKEKPLTGTRESVFVETSGGKRVYGSVALTCQAKYYNPALAR